jgi:hypothetical protein
MDAAPDPVIDMPLEPTAGALGALLISVPPVAVLGGLPTSNGVTLDIAGPAILSRRLSENAAPRPAASDESEAQAAIAYHGAADVYRL